MDSSALLKVGAVRSYERLPMLDLLRSLAQEMLANHTYLAPNVAETRLQGLRPRPTMALPEWLSELMVTWEER